MHDPYDVLSLLRRIAAFFKGTSKGQSFSCFVLRHVPGSGEKLVRRFEDFMVECIYEYKAMSKRVNSIAFEHRQQFLLVTRELDFYLTSLFWGEFNDNRDLLTGEQWLTMNRCAIELSYILDLLKGEFNGTEAYTCSNC